MNQEQITNTNENFSELFSKSEDFAPGKLLTAKVKAITNDYVIVDAGLKSLSNIPRNEFQSYSGELSVQVGDQVELILEASIDDGSGRTHLSREKARRVAAWKNLEDAFESGKNVIGFITERVRGGFAVEIDKIRTFLPGSLLDTKPIHDISYLENKELEFKVIKIDKQQNNIVVSRRAVLLAEGDAERQALLQTLHEGDIVTGIVKNLTDYGAFVDLGGIDGLLHVTDISWRRIKNPNEVLKLGSKIEVKILKHDKEKNRLSLGMKQLADDPWKDIERRYPQGARVFGKVTNLTEYGCFVEIEPGIEGLVHVSEIDWTNKNVNPSKVVQLDQDVEVMILEIDTKKRRISLGIKQCKSNPWEEFALNHKKGEQITGVVKSITDFGVFLGLTGDIDGLIHLSDLSWTEPGENVIQSYKKGQTKEAVILGIDPERERISLGVKQLEQDIYTDYLEENKKGTVVTGKIIEVNAKEAVVRLSDNIEGHIKAVDVSRERVQDVTQYLKVDDEIEAKIMGVDRKNRYVNLSIKALQSDIQEDAPMNTQFGDLLKESIQGNEETESQE